MMRLALVIVALLVMQWHSPRIIVAVQASEPPSDEFDDPPMTPLPWSPPEGLEPQVSPLPESPPPPQDLAPPEMPEPTWPTPPDQLAPSPPKQDPAPPRLIMPPQGPTVATPPPPPPRAINHPASARTTLLVFGDSTVDPGNNNLLQTTAKANFLPYGMNFHGSQPTGRFSNGRLTTDMLAENLGIARSILGFLDPTVKLGQLRRGVSFASAGSGYDDATAKRLNALSLTRQIEYLWHYKLNLQKLVGPRRTEQLVRRATFIISAGTTDLLFHYLTSNQSGENSLPQYENYLVTRIANYTQVMRTLGARRFVFVGVPPLGCLPIARTLLGTGTEKCHENLNMAATSFNSQLVDLLNLLKNEPGTRATYIDIYKIISEAIEDPNKYGLTEISRGCCGSGVIEVGQTCKGRKTCADPSKYLYWDAVHPTERMYQIITDDVIMNSIGEIYN